MPNESKLEKAGEALNAQSQQDEMKKPEDLNVVGSPKGEHPQARPDDSKHRDAKSS